MNNKFVIQELQKQFNLQTEEDVYFVLEGLKNNIKKQLREKEPITKVFLARIIFNLIKKQQQKIKKEDKEAVFKGITHECLLRYSNKFLELASAGWGTQRIRKYFLKYFNCSVSRPTINVALKNFKALKQGDKNGKS